MSAHDHYSWRVKLTQARTHLTTLHGQIATYLTDSHATFRHDYNPELHQIASVLQADYPPPPDIGATVGDVLHNLRSALDNLTWHTVTQANPHPAKPTLVQFPITEDAKTFTKDVPKRLPALNPDTVDVFRSLQPWHWREQAAEVLGRPLDDNWHWHDEALGRLAALSNEDKHRNLHALAIYTDRHWIGTTAGGTVTILAGDPAPWRPGDVVVRWQLASGVPVDVYSPSGDVELGLDDERSEEAMPVLDVLRWIETDVRTTVGRLERDVLNLFSAEDEQRVWALRVAYQQARRAEYEHASQFMSRDPDVAPTPHSPESITARRVLMSKTRDAREAYEAAVLEVYGNY